MTQATTSVDIKTCIENVFADVYAEMNNGDMLGKIANDKVLLETGIDSLGFAIIVTRLEQELGFDPFSLSSEAYYPQTFGDFVSFYESNRPA